MSPISHTMTFMPVASLADRPAIAAEGTVAGQTATIFARSKLHAWRVS